MAKVKDLHRRWSKNPDYKTAYDGLHDEFQLARVLIETRARAGLSQAELATRMNTSQSYIARVEGGQVRPSTGVLSRFAKATGTRLSISFRPIGRRDVLLRLAAQPVRRLKPSAAEVIRAERDKR